MSLRKKNNISVIVIVHNEEKFIRQCLMSILPVASEIIVIHDGVCADDTLKISKSLGAKIFARPRKYDSIPHMPFALKIATNDWILKIDADETIRKQDYKKIEMLIDKDCSAYQFLWKVSNKKYNPHYKTVLFKKAKVAQVGLPHFEVQVDGIKQKTDCVLEHHVEQIESFYKLIKFYLKKDTKFGKISALAVFNNSISMYNCSLLDKNYSTVRKLLFLIHNPFQTMILFPFYSFFVSYILNHQFRNGWLGLILSLRIPIYYLSFGYYRCFKFRSQ